MICTEKLKAFICIFQLFSYDFTEEMFIYHVVFHLLNLFGTFRAIHFSDNNFYTHHSVQSTILRLGPVCAISKFGYPKTIYLIHTPILKKYPSCSQFNSYKIPKVTSHANHPKTILLITYNPILFPYFVTIFGVTCKIESP